MSTHPAPPFDCQVVEPTGQAAGTVVMLHGREMTPDDLRPFAGSLSVPMRFVFPAGPCQLAVGGSAWWPVDGNPGDSHRPRDLSRSHPPGREAARDRLATTLRALRREHTAGTTVLVGFSQGGMLAADCVLHHPGLVDRIALLSSSPIALDEWQPLAAAARQLPVLVAHGRQDEELAFSAGEALRDWFRSAGARVDWLPFDGGHTIPLAVWRALRRFVNHVA